MNDFGVHSGGPAGPRIRSNHLANETSPYLLQHASNPVDWYPWCDAALARAREEAKPIFLSIGYSACHWCHVMERESFSDAAVAAFMNEHFVNIKVDREERPDLDQIYMAAVQVMTGAGGWPMSVFLTPDLKPFYGGTYFPPADVPGRPGFGTVLASVAAAWQTRRDAVSGNADAITRAVTEFLEGEKAASAPPKPDLLARAVEALRGAFDPVAGGFEGAPKFPSAAANEFLMRRFVRTGDAQALAMATQTLDHMARGGIYDQVGGGFHRYATDAAWRVPHFEKMLYDNAQLARAYLNAYQLTGRPLYGRVAAETLDYVSHDLTGPDGRFCASEDADSEGQEGAFYLWTLDEIEAAVGPADGELLAACYGLRREGNFTSHEEYHAGRNILYVARPIEELAVERGVAPETLERRMDALRARLRDVRRLRTRPARDGKAVASWNALMVSALALGHQVLGELRYRRAAERAAAFLLTGMTRDGILHHTCPDGPRRVPGFLDDYAFAVHAFLDLYETTLDFSRVLTARELADRMLDLFWDGAAGAFCLTSDAHAHLIARPKPAFDAAKPSGNAMAALGLLRLGRLMEERPLLETARRVLETFQPMMERAPRGFLTMLCAVDFDLGPAQEVALVGPPDGPAMRALVRALHRCYAPGKIVAHVDPDAADAAERIRRIPWLASKGLVSGRAAAYVCRDYVCQAPVTTPEELERVFTTPGQEGRA